MGQKRATRDAVHRLDPGLHGYFQRTLRELTDIKDALDQVLVVMIADANGVVTYVNDRFCALYQYTREEAVGKPIRFFRSDEHPEEYYQDLWKTISSGRVYSGEVKHHARDGTHFWSQMVIVPFVDPTEKPFQYVVFLADITSMKQAETERIKLLKAEAAVASAEAAIQARDRFVSMAAHELKTPMTSLQLMLDVLIRESDQQLTPEQLKHVRDLLKSASFQTRRLTSMLNDMLDVSRIASGKIDLRCEPVDLGELLRNLISHSREDLELAGCVVELDFRGVIHGLWDRMRLEQVIINLLSNAMKYGKGKPIRIDAKAARGIAEIRVRDQGIGIPLEFRRRLFQRFERADGAKRYQGTGLGLWISQQIAEAHGGNIQVESELGRGSTFIVRLPQNR